MYEHTTKPEEMNMSLIQWNDRLSVHVAEIDGQHQKLVGMINDLNDAMRQGKGNVRIVHTDHELSE
jgi:hemerythrin